MSSSSRISSSSASICQVAILQTHALSNTSSHNGGEERSLIASRRTIRALHLVATKKTGGIRPRSNMPEQEDDPGGIVKCAAKIGSKPISKDNEVVVLFFTSNSGAIHISGGNANCKIENWGGRLSYPNSHQRHKSPAQTM